MSRTLHPFLKIELATDELHLVVLGLVERGGVLPVAATVIHGRAQHPGEHGVVHVVMLLGHHGGPGHALQVEKGLRRHDRKDGQVVVYLGFQMGAYGPAEHHVKLIAVPPTFHVRLARAERALPKNPLVQIGIVNLNIPGPIAPYADIRHRQHRSDHRFCIHAPPPFLVLPRRCFPTGRKASCHDASRVIQFFNY